MKSKLYALYRITKSSHHIEVVRKSLNYTELLWEGNSMAIANAFVNVHDYGYFVEEYQPRTYTTVDFDI